MPQLKDVCSIMGTGGDIDPIIVIHILHHRYDGNEGKINKRLAKIIGGIVLKKMIKDAKEMEFLNGQMIHNTWYGENDKLTESVFGPSPFIEAVKTITMIDEMKKYML